MATQLRLTGASTGSGVAIITSPSGTGGSTFSLPVDGNSTLLTNNSNLSSSKLSGALPVIDGSNLTGIDALPSQTSADGKYLTSNGSSATWTTLAANIPFVKGNGSSDPIALTTDSAIPFLKANGNADNIALTT